jgi:hypothetical protein
LDDEGFLILNGRTQGDEGGSLTFYGGMGESVIDYACVSMNAIDVVGDFRVDVCDHSDHMPIVVELVCRAEGDGAKVCRDAGRLRWNGGFAEGYRERLSLRVNEVMGREEEMNVREIVMMVRDSVCWTSGGGVRFRERWYDWQCERARMRSFECLNRVRNAGGDREVVRMEYRAARDRYREVCKRKRDEYYGAVARRLDAVRGNGEWWAFVNEMRTVGHRVRSGISVNEYAEYFGSQLSERVHGSVFEYAEMMVVDDILDERVGMGEIVGALNGLKDGRAERTAGRGRASGGMVIGYDSRGKGWNARWVDEDGVGVLRVADGRGALVGIVPLYLNCGDWERGFGRLEEWMNGRTGGGICFDR